MKNGDNHNPSGSETYRKNPDYVVNIDAPMDIPASKSDLDPRNVKNNPGFEPDRQGNEEGGHHLRAKTGKRRQNLQSDDRSDTKFPTEPNNPNFPDQHDEPESSQNTARSEKQQNGKRKDGNKEKQNKDDEEEQKEKEPEKPRKPIAEMTEDEKVNEGKQCALKCHAR